MLPHSSGASSHSDGEQLQQPQQQPAKTRRKVGNGRRLPQTRHNGEESDSDGGGDVVAAARPPSRLKGTARRPARKLMLSVTKDLAPEVIRNLCEVNERAGEEVIVGEVEPKEEVKWCERTAATTVPVASASLAVTPLPVTSTPVNLTPVTSTASRSAVAAWSRVLAEANTPPGGTAKSETKPPER